MDRVCKKCGQTKDEKEFRRYQIGKYERTCKECYNKGRQAIRRIQQQRRYGAKMKRFSRIKNPKILAYAAGIIDGEGCIYVARGKPRGLRLTPQFTLKISVGMSTPEAVNFLHQAFGGTLRKYPNHKYKPIYRWEVSTIEAEGVLRCVIPYLQVKKKEATVGLEFRDHLNSYLRLSGRVIDEKEVGTRKQFKKRLEDLK